MERKELDNLYRRLLDFIADCSREEVEEYKDAIIGIKTLIHKHMQR